ncbi:MAG: hypothetical protein Kow0069_23850 [Promethearchaeota archaeon]
MERGTVTDAEKAAKGSLEPPRFLDVGIDAAGFYAPRHRLRSVDLAAARSVDPEKYRTGLMVEEFAVPDEGEDAVSMALVAAAEALRRGGLDPRDVDAVFVGSETPAYAVKSMAAILAGTLGVSERAVTADLSHACASATVGVLNAIGLVSSGVVRRALVVGTDMSKYPLRSPGEPTQGAGAVAMVISNRPRVAQFAGAFGRISGNVNDFFRPHGRDTAVVYGHYSVDAYLSFQQRAHDDLSSRVVVDPDHWVFHSPYAKLPVKFFRQLLVRRWLGDRARLAVVVTEAKEAGLAVRSSEVLPERCVAALERAGLEEGELDAVAGAVVREEEARLRASLDVSRHFGNLYSASVWAQVLHVLEQRAKAGEVVYFGSYGSGATAISGLLRVVGGFRDALGLGSRTRTVLWHVEHGSPINVEEYEARRLGSREACAPAKFAKVVAAAPPAVPGKRRPAARGKRDAKLREVTLSFCDWGCLLPHNPDLAFCPEGHFGRVVRRFPFSATVVRVREAPHEDPLLCMAQEGEVPLLGDARPGDRAWLTFRRLRVHENQLMQWGPAYLPEGAAAAGLPVSSGVVGVGAARRASHRFCHDEADA